MESEFIIEVNFTLWNSQKKKKWTDILKQTEKKKN